MLKKIKIYYLRLKSKILTPRINRDIKKYKYIHVMHNDKFDKPFVDFLNKNFDRNKHMILFYKTSPNKSPTLVPRAKNVYEYVYFKDIKGLLNDNIDKIIFHSLFMPGVVDRLYRESELLKKSYWVMWGADLYNAPRDEKNDFVRKNFKGYLNIIDKNYAIKKYNMIGSFYEMFYPSLIDKEKLDNLKIKKKDYVQIQINNSCDESTLEVLDVLSKYKDENIRITTVLSYGKLEYKEQIIQKGKKIYGNKFTFIDKLLLPIDYFEYIANNDILILNQNRQQGAGNIFAHIYLGKKVYIRENVSTYNQLNKYDNVKIFRTERIKDLSFDDFVKNDYIEQNKKNIEKYVDEKYLVDIWRNIFDAK